MPSRSRSRSSAQTPASRSLSGRLAAPCSSVCGYGRADKEQVGRMVRSILALEDVPAPNHVADALAVAICHALAPPLLHAARLAQRA